MPELSHYVNHIKPSDLTVHSKKYKHSKIRLTYRCQEIIEKLQSKQQLLALNHNQRLKQLQTLTKQQLADKSYRKRSLTLLSQKSKRILQKSSQEFMWVSPFLRSQKPFNIDQKVKVSKHIAVQKPESNELKYTNIHKTISLSNKKIVSIFDSPRKVKTSRKQTNTCLNEIIEQFNRLLRLSRQPKSRMVMKGSTCSLANSYSQRYFKKSQSLSKFEFPRQEEEITWQVFTSYNYFFKEFIREDQHLVKRFVQGLKQDGKFSIQALIRFYEIFVTRQQVHEKQVNFLSYFFLPIKYQTIQIQSLKLLLQVLCDRVPNFDQAQDSQKLYRSLLQSLIESHHQKLVQIGVLSRQVLTFLLVQNPDAVSLLLTLFYKKQP